MLYSPKDMKTLKLDHKLAMLVQQGHKTTTWRLYDDKDISVNDEVRLIDKVDSGKPDTWKPIGTALIDEVVEKRLGDLSDNDYDGHEKFSSKDELLTTYRQYYGQQVTMSTPVKIIKFSFTPAEHGSADNDVNEATKYKELNLYADGGSRGNPGPSASGFALIDEAGRVVVKKGEYLGITTNNQAEYQSLKLGLEEARRLQVSEVHVYMDSQLVVRQMQGVYKVKNRDLWPIYTAIKDLVTTFKRVTFSHVPREMNKIADGAVNEALDEAAGKSRSGIRPS